MCKKKIPKKILIPIIATVLVVITSISIFFVVKNNKKTEQDNTPEASNVALKLTASEIDKKVNQDVVNKNVSVNLTGKYIYSSIVELVYEENAISAYQNLTYTKIDNSKASQLQNYLHKLKHRHYNEYISLYNGKYIKQNNNILAEEGFYYGNDDKSYIYIKNPDGTISQNNELYSISYEISQTGYWLNQTPENDGTQLYVREKILCNNRFFLVTYLYKIV